MFVWLQASHNDRSEYHSCSHTHSLTYFSFYRSHTLCSRLQSSVSYWPSVSLPIQLSVCVCAAVWGSDRSRWRWVYNHETVIVVFIIILLLFLLLTENNKHNARVQRLCRKRYVDSPHFCQMTHPKALQSPDRSDGMTIFLFLTFSQASKRWNCQIHHHKWHYTATWKTNVLTLRQNTTRLQFRGMCSSKFFGSLLFI